MTFVGHINRNSAFFVILAIYIVNTCLVVFSNLFAVTVTQSTTTGSTNSSNSELEKTLSTFWQLSVLTVLGDKK